MMKHLPEGNENIIGVVVGGVEGRKGSGGTHTKRDPFLKQVHAG